MNAVTRKTTNRLKDLLGTLSVGRKIDLGRPHEKGYRLCIGRTIAGQQARFWLGHDEAEAQQRARAVVEMFSIMVADGVADWTPDLVKTAKEAGERRVSLFRRVSTEFSTEATRRELDAVKYRQHADSFAGRPLTTAVTIAPAVVDAPVASPTLYAAIRAYLDALKAKRISDVHRWRAEQVLERSLKGVRADMPIAKVDFAWIDALCDHFKSRPTSQKKNKAGRRQPISAETVKTTLSYLRRFFVWIDDTGFGGWEAPRKLTKPFSVRIDDLRTPAETRASKAIRQFDVPTLVKIYRAGSDYQKAIILCALFTAGTQKELAVLEKDEFDLDAGVLSHFRNKTGVEGRFWLPPELVTLLRVEFRKHRKMPLAFYTTHKSPLVTFKDGKLASDAVRQMWDDLRVKAEVPDALSFKFVRKFAGDWMLRHGGEAMGQVALSHAPTTVLARHYSSSRDFDTFNGLQRQMHAEFVAAGMFA